MIAGLLHCLFVAAAADVSFIQTLAQAPGTPAAPLIKAASLRETSIHGNIELNDTVMAQPPRPAGRRRLPTTLIVYGEPHMKNMYGEQFNILQPGWHALLIIPRGATSGDAYLAVHGQVSWRGPACSDQLFLTLLALAGEWFGALGGVRLAAVGEMFDTDESMGLQIGDSANLSVEDFARRMPAKLADVTRFHPEPPEVLSRHAITLAVRLYLGPMILKITWEHQKERVGFSNSLTLLVYGLSEVESEVGGFLGQDDHETVARHPKECIVRCKDAMLLAPPRFIGGARVSNGPAKE